VCGCLLIFNSVIDLELYENIIGVDKIKTFLNTFINMITYSIFIIRISRKITTDIKIGYN